MKITEIKELAIPEIKVIRYNRFKDHRGYFTETYRKSDLLDSGNVPFLKGEEFLQANESFSYKGAFRGLHFQWNPYMGKLVRPVTGHMIDFVLDIRRNSPTIGKIIGYDMPAARDSDSGEFIWVPPGFAHGILLLEDSLVEYFCTGEYSQGCEAGISPFSDDFDWSLCDREIKRIFNSTIAESEFISDKDRSGFSLTGWLADERSNNFIYRSVNGKEG